MMQSIGRAHLQKSYSQLVETIFGTSIIGYWPLDELVGATNANDISSNARNGTYTSVTLNNALSPQNKPTPLFGTGSFANIYSAALNAAFNNQEGGFLAWVKVLNSSVWTDGAARHIVELRASTTNRIFIRKDTVDGKLSFVYMANNVIIGSTFLSVSPTGWFCVAIGWSKSGDFVKRYINGGLQGDILTGLDIWTGALLSTNATIGAANTSASLPWSGWIADSVLINRPPTDLEVMQFYNTRKIISIIGDSIPNDPSEFPYMVQTSIAGATIINHAVPGQSIMLHMDAQVAAAASDNANIIILELGTNDDNAGDMAALQAKVENNIVALKTSNPRATLYYMDVLKRWLDNTTGAEVDKSNIRTAIAAACTSQGIACWDTYTSSWITQAQTVDGTHPTTAGHIVIAAQVLSRLP